MLELVLELWNGSCQVDQLSQGTSTGVREWFLSGGPVESGNWYWS